MNWKLLTVSNHANGVLESMLRLRIETAVRVVELLRRSSATPGSDKDPHFFNFVEIRALKWEE